MPVMLLTLATLFAVPGDARLLVLAVILLGMAAISVLTAVRWLTFERYLT